MTGRHRAPISHHIGGALTVPAVVGAVLLGDGLDAPYLGAGLIVLIFVVQTVLMVRADRIMGRR